MSPALLWHNIETAAAIAGRTPKAMRELRRRNQGPKFRKVDGRLVVSDADLQAWLSGTDTAVAPVARGRARKRSTSVA